MPVFTRQSVRVGLLAIGRGLIPVMQSVIAQHLSNPKPVTGKHARPAPRLGIAVGAQGPPTLDGILVPKE